ncbi:hypothetical protein Pta6605_29190 [Pseudomonas amygdali pv. tabaci]|nr:hypothetical protein Pta6605_29190 [Pseudomonas amygdali pv. tabaci]
MLADVRRFLIDEIVDGLFQSAAFVELVAKVHHTLDEDFFPLGKHERQTIEKARGVRPAVMPVAGDTGIEGEAY